MATGYKNEIASLKEENTRLSKKNQSGESSIFHLSKAMIADFQKSTQDLDKTLIEKNEVLSKDYLQDIQLTTWTLI